MSTMKKTIFITLTLATTFFPSFAFKTITTITNNNNKMNTTQRFIKPGGYSKEFFVL